MSKLYTISTLIAVVVVGGLLFHFDTAPTRTNITPVTSEPSMPVKPSNPIVTPPSQPIPVLKPISKMVTISSVSPSTGKIGTTVTVFGLGFTSSNTIYFSGSVVASNVQAASSNGKMSLVFNVPESIGPNCKAGEACPMYLRFVTPGTYTITVENGNGTSNPSNFIVTDSAKTQ